MMVLLMMTMMTMMNLHLAILESALKDINKNKNKTDFCFCFLHVHLVNKLTYDAVPTHAVHFLHNFAISSVRYQSFYQNKTGYRVASFSSGMPIDKAY